ncbi:multimerin-2 [Heterocephalus glaber]|uniref:Multimerin-2 n=1 Tax=Heterocephalus glaber TaxID=10181 RepID=A0AAX6Q8H1_HETGA|nr:multimerin-2 [Heterocephalus glaber]
MILTLLISLGGPLGWGLLGVEAQAPGRSFSDPQRPRLLGPPGTKAEDGVRGPSRSNWCPYQTSRLATFIAACKMERFLVHSQQPCPQSTPNCQRDRVMYRIAHKPVYQVKQRVLTALAWRCCPGFQGPDCQLHDPTVTTAPVELDDSRLEPWEQPAGLELGHLAAELKDAEGSLTRDLQNDVHQAADGLPDPWASSATGDLTVRTTEVNKMEPDSLGRSLEQGPPLHMDAFLQEHFSPIWRSFKESLYSLSQAVRNLSLEVEANRQALQHIQDSAVAGPNFQEVSAKFEAKVKEHGRHMEQLRQDVEGRLHAQHLSLHQALTEVQAEVDGKVKQLLKAQEPPGTNGRQVGAAARPEPESLQARLGQLQRNLSALHTASSQREEELAGTLEDMRVTLAQHTDEIKELYTESDETFDQISRVERLVGELQVNHTGLRELRVDLMEKSLIMEENKEEVERGLQELNVTLQQLQSGHADLTRYLKDCSCPKLSSDPDPTGAPEETPRAPDVGNDSSLPALHAAVDAVLSTVDVLRAESEHARAERARLRARVQALDTEASALRVAVEDSKRDARQLHSSFAALLQDGLRHEAALAALFGEEALEELSEGAPGPLHLRYGQILEALRDAARGLQEQAVGWNELDERVANLQHAREVEEAGQGCEASWATKFNGSLQGLQGALSATQRDLEQQQRLFHGLFGNFQGLLTANVSLDLGKLQVMLSRKGKKQQKDPAAAHRRDKKQVASLEGTKAKGEQEALGARLWGTGSPVAFYASLSDGTGMAAPQTVKFNATTINAGTSYFPKLGYFQAPERGIYMFAVSVEFGPGPGTGQLVIGGHHRTPVCTTAQSAGGTATTFAMAELRRGERVWFELTQGTVAQRSPVGTAFGGFMMFST